MRLRALAPRRFVLRLLRDTRGANAVEFALLVPVMMVGIMGLCDLTYQAYVEALLEGSILKAGRDSAIQGGAQRAAELDQRVMTEVRRVAKTATYTSTRRSYANFSNIRPENFTDRNGNGVRDAGECFDDINGNKTWDADPGLTGQGGANDSTVYTITVTYPRLFPTGRLLGWGNSQTVSATTTLKNQPYATQAASTTTTICT